MTGRMKGQAFVTFPSIESAREALVTVNGYILNEKPIVVVGIGRPLQRSVLENRVSLCIFYGHLFVEGI